jgi:hypothetical protein
LQLANQLERAVQQIELFVDPFLSLFELPQTRFEGKLLG